jgi:hypothetical protein
MLIINKYKISEEKAEEKAEEKENDHTCISCDDSCANNSHCSNRYFGLIGYFSDYIEQIIYICDDCFEKYEYEIDICPDKNIYFVDIDALFTIEDIKRMNM